MFLDLIRSQLFGMIQLIHAILFWKGGFLLGNSKQRDQFYEMESKKAHSFMESNCKNVLRSPKKNMSTYESVQKL